jgi:hypothetical protein
MDPQSIHDVESVTLSILKTNPATLEIQVSGHTTTTGWTDIKLNPRVYVAPPANGIWEFDLQGVPPGGIAGQIMLPVSTEYKWKNFPPAVKGIKVYSASNYKSVLLNRNKPKAPATDPGIQILKFEAWVNMQPVQPTAGGTLIVSLDYNSNDHGFHNLVPMVPQGINPKILMLELTSASEMIYILNPRHNSYSQGLTNTNQYSSIELYYGGEKIGSVNNIPVVN